MKWARAVHYLADLAQKCAERAELPESIRGLPVVELWTFGDVLGEPREVEVVRVALVVDLPEVPWLSAPHGAEHWANATRMAKNPIAPVWRSADALVWNHFVDRPARIWSVEDGVAQSALEAIRDGKGPEIRLPAPSPGELRERLDEEMALSLRSLREQTRGYDESRWGPGKVMAAADALWRAADGYLDLLDAMRR
ncbi:hypothetical protein [Actinocrispum sp. NPDC049592]|uniref:DUF7711 family protein n=1 Tax=Actinocrispum sp. NPDC049592 TaxID=3154835 RepID=UPI003438A005